MLQNLLINRLSGGLVVFALLLVVTIAGCSKDISDSDKRQTIKALANYNTNQFLLNKLKENRILFIGDFGHRRYLYKRTVRDFLNYWLDQIEKGTESVPRKLFLVLETDSLEASRMRASAGHFDFNAWLYESRSGSLTITTGHLQFLYHDVGEILNSVAEYNARNPDDSIFFDIVAPERVVNVEERSIAERDSMFVYVRDELLSNKVIKLLDRNPDYKAVIFYGAAHMQTGKQLKSTETVSDSGYYLAHHIAERFEDDGGVYDVFQTSITEPFMRTHSFMKSPGKTYATDNTLLDMKWFACVGYPDWIKMCDGSIVYFEPAVIDPPLGTIQSTRIADCLLGEIKKYEGTEHYFLNKYWLGADRYLKMVSGGNIASKNPRPYEDWVRWRDTTELDMVNDIVTLNLWRRQIDNMEAAGDEIAPRYDSLVSRSLRGLICKDTTKTLDEKVEAYREYLNSYGDVVIIENLVNLLLVGTGEEIAKALPILRDSTGQDFATPWEWADWLRESGLVFHPY